MQIRKVLQAMRNFNQRNHFLLTQTLLYWQKASNNVLRVNGLYDIHVSYIIQFLPKQVADETYDLLHRYLSTAHFFLTSEVHISNAERILCTEWFLKLKLTWYSDMNLSGDLLPFCWIIDFCCIGYLFLMPVYVIFLEEQGLMWLGEGRLCSWVIM